MREWVTNARNLQGDDIKMMLVGNKIDLSDKRQVSTEDGQKLADELKIGFIETSSKDGTNVYDLFKNIASSLPGLEGAEITSNNDRISLLLKYSCRNTRTKIEPRECNKA